MQPIQWTLIIPKVIHTSKAQPFGHFSISKITCHSSSMAMALPNPPQGLASELWHGLQVKNLLGLIIFFLIFVKTLFQLYRQALQGWSFCNVFPCCTWTSNFLFQAALLSVITSLDMAAISGLAPPSAPAPLLQVLVLLGFPKCEFAIFRPCIFLVNLSFSCGPKLSLMWIFRPSMMLVKLW